MLQGVGATQGHQRLHLAFAQRTISFRDAFDKRCKGVFGEADLRGFCFHLLNHFRMLLPEFVPHDEGLFLSLQGRQQAIQTRNAVFDAIRQEGSQFCHQSLVLLNCLLKIFSFRDHINQISLPFLLQRLAQNGQIFLLLLGHVVDVVQVSIKDGLFAVIAEHQCNDDQGPKSIQLDLAPSLRRSFAIVDEKFLSFLGHYRKQRQKYHHEEDGTHEG